MSDLLDATTVEQLQRLRLSTLGALIAGLSAQRDEARAPRIEFSDHRPYVPGDELRRIDWNVYARLRQLAVKVGPEEGRLSIAILVDRSRSMRFGDPSKARHAQRLAACLGAVALLDGDVAQVAAAGDGRAVELGRLESAPRVIELADEVGRLPEAVTTDLAGSVADHLRQTGRADLAVLVSDMNVPADEVAPAADLLARAGRSATLFHVVAPQERETDLRGPVELRDAETGRTIATTVTEARAAEYARRFAEFAATVEQRCHAEGVTYLRADTDVEPLDLLFANARRGAVLAP